MIKVNEIAFTGYPVTDLKRARHFYESVLGLKPSKVFGDEKSAWIEYDIGANTLAIGNGAPDWKPSSGGAAVALELEDFPSTVAALKNSGVPFRFEPMETPVCHMAVITDPDGNSLVIHKRKSLK